MMLIDTCEQGDQINAGGVQILADTATVKCDKHHQMLLIKRLWNICDGQKLGWMTYD